MVILTAKLSKSKLIAAALVAVAVILLVIFLANRGTATDLEPVSAPKLRTIEDMVQYLSTCGYSVEAEPLRKQEVVIPKEFGEVYQQYNALQQSQGFHLEKYKGKKVTQYVFLVTNYPQEDPQPVHATLLIYRNKLIGGELSREGENGFMRPLLSS